MTQSSPHMALRDRGSVVEDNYSPRRRLDFNGYGDQRNNSPLRERSSLDARCKRLEIDYLKEKLQVERELAIIEREARIAILEA